MSSSSSKKVSAEIGNRRRKFTEEIINIRGGRERKRRKTGTPPGGGTIDDLLNTHGTYLKIGDDSLTLPPNSMPRKQLQALRDKIAISEIKKSTQPNRIWEIGYLGVEQFMSQNDGVYDILLAIDQCTNYAFAVPFPPRWIETEQDGALCRKTTFRTRDTDSSALSAIEKHKCLQKSVPHGLPRPHPTTT